MVQNAPVCCAEVVEKGEDGKPKLPEPALGTHQERGGWKTAHGDAARADGWWRARKTKTQPRGAQHAARLRSGSFLAGSANQTRRSPAPRMAVEWLCRRRAEGCLRSEICMRLGGMQRHDGVHLRNAASVTSATEALCRSVSRGQPQETSCVACGSRPISQKGDGRSLVTRW